MAFAKKKSRGHRLLSYFFLTISAGSSFVRAAETAVAKADAPNTGGDSVEADPYLTAYPTEDDPAYTTEVRGYRVRRTEETAAFAETIDVAATARTMTSLGEVLSKSVGVEVRSAGGLGAYGSASIRGSTANQVPVYLDGIEVQSGGSSAVDLSEFALDAFESLEVYRGSTPLAVGRGGIGGALYLRTRTCDDVSAQAAATYGSWQTWRGFGLECAAIGDVSALALFSAHGTKGDFEYLNRNGTWLDSSDDRVEKRDNNRYTAYYTLVKIQGPVKSWKLTGAGSILASESGLPGIESVQTRTASSTGLGDRLTLRAEGPVSKKLDLELTGGYAGSRARFSNPILEFNQTARSITSMTHATQGSIVGRLEWSDSNTSFVRAENRFETFSHEEQPGGGPTGSSAPVKRIRTLIGIQHDLRPGPAWLLSPQLSAAIHNARRPGGPSPTGDGRLNPDSKDSLYWSPALGARWEAFDGVVLRANVGRYVRPPDITELYGYSGSVNGNPDLKDEVSSNVDFGAALERISFGPVSRVRLDSAWFGSFSDDLIAYEQNSQSSVRPENVSKALATGIETSLDLEIVRAVSLDTNYTYLYTLNRSDTTYHQGNRLPGLPTHRLYSKLEIEETAEGWGFGAFWDVDFATETYLTRSNQPASEIPRRVLLGCGYRLSHLDSGITMTLSVMNLLDRITFTTGDGRPAPLSDYLRFPLPGRTVLLTLHWRG